MHFSIMGRDYSCGVRRLPMLLQVLTKHSTVAFVRAACKWEESATALPMLGHADASSCMQEKTEALQRCAAHAVSPEAVTNLLVTMGANPVPGPRALVAALHVYRCSCHQRLTLTADQGASLPLCCWPDHVTLSKHGPTIEPVQVQFLVALS